MFSEAIPYIVVIKIGLLEQWIENDLSGRVNPYITNAKT